MNKESIGSFAHLSSPSSGLLIIAVVVVFVFTVNK